MFLLQTYKRYIKRNRSTPLYKLKLAQLKERIEAENVPLPEHGRGRMGRIQKRKHYVAAIKMFYEPEEELIFDEPPIDGGSYLRRWTMTVSLGHSKEKEHSVFFEAVR